MNIGAIIINRQVIKDFFLEEYNIIHMFKGEYLKSKKIIKLLYSQNLDQYITTLETLKSIELSYIWEKQKEVDFPQDLDLEEFIEKLSFLFRDLYKDERVKKDHLIRLNNREDYDLDPLLEALPFLLE